MASQVQEDLALYHRGTLVRPEWVNNPVRQALIQLMALRKPLSFEQADEVMDEVGAYYAGKPAKATLEQIVTLHAVLTMGGLNAESLAGITTGSMRWQQRVTLRSDDAICTAGMGGDRFKTVNVSSPASVISTSAGARVAKHGARAVTGVSGSSDWFHRVGVNLQTPADAMARICDETGLGFFEFTQHNNFGLLCFKVMAPTFFELLGPLTNPCNIRGHVCGAIDRHSQDMLAETYAILSARGVLPQDFRVFIPCGLGPDGDGIMDEISTFGPTRVVEVRNGQTEVYVIHPEDCGLHTSAAEAVAARQTAPENIAATVRVIAGEETGPIRDLLVLNAASHLYVAGRAPTLADGVRQAQAAVETGAARQQLGRFVAAVGASNA